MNAIDILSNEHRLIERTLDAILVWSDEVRRGKPHGDNAELRRFVTFLREFVDDWHHAKEEQILFATMKAHGISGPHGPCGIMLHEHDQGRALISALDCFARQAEPWSDDDRDAVAEAAITYAALMRQHILKEDTILYPMAAARLPADTWAELAQRLERFDRVETGPGTHVLLHRLAESLVAAHQPRAL